MAAFVFLAAGLWFGFGAMSILAGINSDNVGARGEWSDGDFDHGAGEVYRGRRAKKPDPGPVPDRDSDLARADALAEEMSRRISEHDSLPRESLLGSIGLSVLANDQKHNSVAMSKILDELATEIGATKAAGAIREIQENRERQSEMEGLSKSEDPAVRERAKASLEKILEENEVLESFVRQSFSDEGIELSKEQVKSLCASPNAEDTASMISAFVSLKLIAGKMEERLRWSPTQEQAQKYYGAHYAMLLALDKIQAKAAGNIRDIYVPAAVKIGEDAEKTSREADEILSQGGISGAEEQALRWNVVSCGKTAERAARTARKLETNLEIISRSREKLAKSIATAKNCHSTAMLQKQIIRLEGTAFQEFARIEALTIPPLVAVNFADPETPEVAPVAKPPM